MDNNTNSNSVIISMMKP